MRPWPAQVGENGVGHTAGAMTGFTTSGVPFPSGAAVVVHPARPLALSALLVLGAPRFLQHVGQDGYLVEGPLIVDGTGHAGNSTVVPGEYFGTASALRDRLGTLNLGAAETHRPPGVAEDAADEGGF